MAGSYNHAVNTDTGQLHNWRHMTMATGNGGDAYETVEEFYGMVWFLADGDPERVELARQNYARGLEMSPGHEDESARYDDEDEDER